MGEESAFRVCAFSAEEFQCCLENQGLFAREQAELHFVANYLAQYLQDLGAATIVVEIDYVDGDFLDDYASYYVRCFDGYRRFCRRLHFFRQEIDADQFGQWLGDPSWVEPAPDLDAGYLGFIVVKPLGSSIIGRTDLAPLVGEDDGEVTKHFPGYPHLSASSLWQTAYD